MGGVGLVYVDLYLTTVSAGHGPTVRNKHPSPVGTVVGSTNRTPEIIGGSTMKLLPLS